MNRFVYWAFKISLQSSPLLHTQIRTLSMRDYRCSSSPELRSTNHPRLFFSSLSWMEGIAICFCEINSNPHSLNLSSSRFSFAFLVMKKLIIVSLVFGFVSGENSYQLLCSFDYFSHT